MTGSDGLPGAAHRLRTDPGRSSEAGITLVELLVVLIILVVVLGGLATLFASAIKSETDQTNRVQAQQDARVSLDQLRREIHCASSVSSAAPAALTIVLPSFCPSAPAGGGSVTWCVTGAAAPYSLVRYLGAACSGTKRILASLLRSNAVFSYNRTSLVSPPTFPSVASTGGTLGPGKYWYDVTAVLASGVEVSGQPASVTVSSTTSTNAPTVSWTAYSGAASYNVYGRDDGSNTSQGFRLLGSVASNTFPDTGPPVTSTALSPPLATVSVTLTTDKTPSSTSQQFSFSDDIVLRNSGRF